MYTKIDRGYRRERVFCKQNLLLYIYEIVYYIIEQRVIFQ